VDSRLHPPSSAAPRWVSLSLRRHGDKSTLYSLLSRYRVAYSWPIRTNTTSSSPLPSRIQGGALRGFFLLGKSPPLPYGSRRLQTRKLHTHQRHQTDTDCGDTKVQRSKVKVPPLRPDAGLTVERCRNRLTAPAAGTEYSDKDKLRRQLSTAGA